MLEIALAHGCQLSRQSKSNWTLEIMQISLAYENTVRRKITLIALLKLMLDVSEVHAILHC